MQSFLVLSLACSAWVQHVTAQSSGTFNTLTFNVAGLPAILNPNEGGDKTQNTARIGELFTRYNFSLIHVQEDFNYHATLYANDKHPYRTPTSGGVPFGSGLNSLSNYEYSAFQRVKWNTCSTFDGADCLTPKGFTFMKVKFGEGVFVDAYNLHADAGTTDADLKARAANLKQVSDYIKTNSVGNPVVVFGDSNTRYTRAQDNPSIFRTENGMTDAWVQLVRNGNEPVGGTDALMCDNPSSTTACEIVDKVWYRGSAAVSLQATQFQYIGNMFLTDGGEPLSDHNPVLVDFTWTRNAQRTVSKAFGGDHEGFGFNNLDSLAGVANAKVASVTLRGAKRLDAVSITLASGQTFAHGGDGGQPSTLTLAAGESLTGATLCRGQRKGKTRVFYAEVRSSEGKKISAGGKTGDCTEFSAGEGRGIIGFHGRAGDEIDQLGFVYGSA